MRLRVYLEKIPSFTRDAFCARKNKRWTQDYSAASFYFREPPWSSCMIVHKRSWPRTIICLSPDKPRWSHINYSLYDFRATLRTLIDLLNGTDLTLIYTETVLRIGWQDLDPSRVTLWCVTHARELIENSSSLHNGFTFFQIFLSNKFLKLMCSILAPPNNNPKSLFWRLQWVKMDTLYCVTIIIAAILLYMCERSN